MKCVERAWLQNVGEADREETMRVLSTLRNQPAACMLVKCSTTTGLLINSTSDASAGLSTTTTLFVGCGLQDTLSTHEAGLNLATIITVIACGSLAVLAGG